MLDFARCRVGGIDTLLQFLKLLDWSDIKPSQFAEWFRFQERLRDGGMGPEMVVIPAGEFLMGSPEDESERQASEGPQHLVTFSQPFAMGRYSFPFLFRYV
ncbi:MAG TPA: SUMF1/EgtB/PvdO family nonheme iron enzyme, partial [Xanthomonadaceae bacterium]|nr:SUMF1/EgtB/PvdO family nonheme iron enzyme [Xanthomonadaceae bacterium]